MDKVLLLRVMEKDRYSTYNRKLLPTLTLCIPLVVLCMVSVLLLERTMGEEDVTSTYKYQ